MFTLERFLPPMHAYMGFHVLQFGVEPPTIVTRQNLVLSQGLHVAYVDLFVSFVPLILLLTAVGLLYLLHYKISVWVY